MLYLDVSKPCMGCRCVCEFLRKRRTSRTKSISNPEERTEIAVKPNVSNLFFTAFDHTLKKALGCRISGNSIVANNLSAGNAFWVAVTYVKK